MPNIRGDRAAFGAPGIDPRWTAGNKDAIGTAYDDASQLWFTLWRGIVTEVYYPTIDRPQIRDLQLMITDGKTFVHEEKRHLDTTIEPLDGHTLGYRIRNADPEGRYTIVKEIIVEPHLSCLLQQITIEGDPKVLRSLKFYVLCAPHLDVGGADNSGYVMRSPMNDLLMAERDGTWLALGADIPFCKLSVGFVGFSDGWRDLTDNFAMDWEFDKAEKGNIALFGELDLDFYAWPFLWVERSTCDVDAFSVARNSILRASSKIYRTVATPVLTYPPARPCKFRQWQVVPAQLQCVAGT
jgi:glucoamylase